MGKNNGWKYPTSIGFRNKGQAIPPLIFGGGAFPMRTWIIKPYGDALLNEQKRYLNYRLSRARMET